MKNTRLTKDVPLSPGQLKLIIMALLWHSAELEQCNEYHRDQDILAKYLKTFVEEVKS